MDSCTLTISTTTDGVENSFRYDAEMDLSPFAALLRYKDGNAVVTLSFSRSSATLKREGDYSLFLSLENGKKTLGSLGLGETEGSLPVKTHSIAFTTTKKSLLASLKYALYFGAETQETSIRLTARAKEGKQTEEK